MSNEKSQLVKTLKVRQTGPMSYLSMPITTEGLRHLNRASVLKALRQYGPLAHTAIIEKTGLASGTVSIITAEFVEEGVLHKLEQAPASGRGRPRILFGPCCDYAHLVMVRISAEAVQCSMVDYCGTLLDRRAYDRDSAQTDVVEFGASLKDTLKAFIARSNLEPGQISVISITSKGEIDETRQRLMWSPLLDYQALDFNALFADWSAKIELSTEASFVAHNKLLEAVQKGEAKPGDAHAVLSWADSISLGFATLTEEGNITLNAPSFGHMPHDVNGPLCRCGARGCLESYAGFYGILRTAFEAPADTIPAKFIPLEQMRRIADSARRGDRMTEYGFAQAGRVLGLGLARLFNLLGPVPVTIVGNGAEFFDLIEAGLKEGLGNNFMSRMGQLPDVLPQPEGTELAFNSNVFLSLKNFDQDRIATRKYKKS